MLLVCATGEFTQENQQRLKREDEKPKVDPWKVRLGSLGSRVRVRVDLIHTMLCTYSTYAVVVLADLMKHGISE